MKTSLLLTAALTAATGLSLAQGPYSRDGYGNQRYYDYDRRGPAPAYRGDLVGRVINDLSQAGSRGWMENHDRKHLERAWRDLDRFQEKLSRGRFDHGRLDSAIGNLEHVVRADRVDPRTRGRLARDLQELRAFRARGGSYGPGMIY